MKNQALMQLMADVCGMEIVVPKNGKVDPVGLGAAMLGRYAAEARKGEREGQAERLWGIMVRFPFSASVSLLYILPGRDDAHRYSYPSNSFYQGKEIVRSQIQDFFGNY